MKKPLTVIFLNMLRALHENNNLLEEYEKGAKERLKSMR